jgi:hypothetical protein
VGETVGRRGVHGSSLGGEDGPPFDGRNGIADGDLGQGGPGYRGL